MNNSFVWFESKYRLLFSWVFVNLLGGVLGEFIVFIVLSYVVLYKTQLSGHIKTNYGLETLIGLGLGALFGFVVGMFQKLIIKHYIKAVNSWILVTLIGFSFGFALNSLYDILLPSEYYFLSSGVLLFWIISGLLIGIFQSAILKEIFINSKFWILANLIQGLVTGIAGQRYGIYSVILWGCSSIITGIVLIWLLNKQNQQKWNPNPIQ